MALQASPCLSQVKVLIELLRNFNGRINREDLRVRRPNQTIFLCGGLISPDARSKNVISLRDYLIRYKKIGNKIDANWILAETAQQLYRDTHYPDLISFEEDIARISSIVLVISESAGSLAELGAFASEAVIQDTLRIIMSEQHAEAESFVRYGPVRRIENINRERVGVFPWRTHSRNGNIVKASINPHFSEIERWINQHLAACHDTFSYRAIPEKAIFYDILWILSLMEVAPPEPLYEAVRVIHPEFSEADIRDKLYVLKTCQWIGKFSYGGRDFYYLPENRDPYEYAFIEGFRPRDVAATKIPIVREFHQAAGVNAAVMRRLQQLRGQNR